MIEMIETTISLPGYTLDEQIYEGTRTRVYRGSHLTDSIPVVVKILRHEYPSFTELIQFRNQYAIAKQLNLPGVVKPYSLEPYRNGYALVMEDVGGVSLGSTSAISSLEDFLQIAIQLAEILNGIHRHSIVHKDIKPANILINPNTKQVYLIDFSIASQLPKETPELQNPNVLEGTLAYISPEQTGRMNRGIDYRSDLYSLGVTFYELLAGRLPFISEDPMELVHCHIAKIAPFVIRHPSSVICEEIPSVISEIVMKLMAKNAEDRYQSALGLKYDLQTCLYQLKETGKIENFEIGKRDLCDRFLIPEKLYGREREVEILLQAFERIAAAEEDEKTPNSKSELMLISGFSGIGKTVVVNEVHKPMARRTRVANVRQKGYFIKGKFDQFNRNIPFSAFVQAFRDLMKQLLSESEDCLDLWKSRILAALGDNGQVIVEVIPELESIVGKQPTVPELSGSASQSRFNLLLQKFVRVFASFEHPLVLFLDDLQWADSASLNLMQLLLSDAEMGYFLTIGAYRDNEVFPGHPLAIAIDKMQKANVRIETITLMPLAIEDTNHLIADTLKCDADLARPLTELVYRKTQGNPFFTTQFLKSLHDEGWIVFDCDRRYWQCDIARVRSLSLTDDVVEFMALQLQKLPEETLDILKLAACIGNRFDLETLAIVCEKSEAKISANLWKALKDGLIVPQDEVYKFYQDAAEHPEFLSLEESRLTSMTISYKFIHDRVQQAAYFLIPEDEKSIAHLKIGKQLLKTYNLEQQDDRIFEIVSQLNSGRSLVTDRQELDELAHLNSIAGQKAKLSTAYTAAIEYLTVGVESLSETSWQDCYSLTLSLYENLAESAYLNGDLDRLERYSILIFEKTIDILDKIKTYEIKIQALVAQNKLQKAVRLGLQILNQLEINLAVSPTQDEVFSELQQTQTLLADRTTQELLDLALMKDQSQLAAMKILLSIAAAAYISVPNLYLLIVFKLIELSLHYGNANSSIYAYAAYGLLLCGVIGDIEMGVQFGQLAIDLLERLEAKELTAKTFVLVDGFIKHWKHHTQETLPTLLEGYEAGLNTGDLEFSAYCIFLHFYHCYLVGQNLESLEKEMNTYDQIMRKINQNTTRNWHQAYWQAVLNLTQDLNNGSQLIGTAYDETLKLEIYQKSQEKSGLFHLYFNKLILSYLFNEHELAIENAEKARQYLEGVVALVAVPTFCFYDAIAQLSIARNCSKLEREKIIKHVTKTQENLKKWASHAPLNHLQKYHIVEAELHRVCDRKLEAMELYDRAIYTAKENGYIQEEALANELAAKFYLEWGKEKIAQTYLIESYYCYARWGAKAKLYHLEKQYPQLISAIIDRPQSETPTKISETMPLAQTISIESFGTKSILDLNSILKVSQAISEEIDLEKLLVGLMRVVIENSGTQHGKIVLKQDKNWVIEARARQNINTSDLQIDVLQSIPIENSSNLPQSILYYVIHTQETLVLDLNSARTQFAADPYFLDRQPQSILCLPIVKQGQLIGILYLENQLTAGVFTSDRIEVLKLLVSQAAISIENARLYAKLSRAKERLEEHAQTLETKVEERTTALQQTIDCLEREMHDRQQAETLLRESEQYHRQLFEQSPIGLALCDLQGNLVYVNSAYAEIIGRTVEETLSLSYWQITPEKYAADEAIQLQNLQETGRYGPYEKEYIHQDGHLVPVCLSGILVRKDGKQLIWSSVEDITERKVTEQALQHSKQQLEDAQKLAHIGNWHFDLSTGTITWSDEAFRIHQQPTEQPEPSYSEFLEILHPDDRESLHTAVTNAIERGESYDIEYRLNIANGNLRYVNAKGEAIVNESGQIVALFGTVLDITDRKTADEKLLKQEQFLRSIYDGAEQALFVIDVMPEGELRYGGFNPIAERYGGVTTEQIEGKTPEQAFGLEVGSYLRQKYEQCLQAGTAIFYEEHLQFEERELWTLTSLSPLKDTQGKIYRLIGTANDITVRKRQEEALQLIVEGTTARTGEDFFRTFVRYLAQALQIRYALIAKVDRRNDRYIATTLAFWAGEDWGDNIEYDLTGTPCAQVYEIGTLCRYPCAVQPLFPDDPYLEMLNAESYVGIPVVDTGGNLQGLVAVLDTEPMDRDLDMQSSILEIFAARAGAEIERMRSEEALRQSQIQLQQQAQRERLLNSVTDRIRSSLDFETILASAVGEIRNFLQVDRCHFAWYYHETPDPYWQVVSESREPGLPDFTGCYPVAAFGPLSEMVIRQDVLRFDDVEGIDDPTVRDYVRSLGNQSMLVIPMQSYLGRIGILACIHSQAVRPWCEEELELLQAMMGQLAIALNQAELYTQSCNKAMELEQTLSELQRTQAQLVQSEKMSSLGQMVAGVAHEINNPVSFIAGNVHHAQEYFEDLLDLVMLYQEELPQPSLKLQEKLEELDLEFLMKDLQKLLKSMKIGSDRIRQIVLSLRNFSRLDESDMKEVDLHEGIENTLLILQHRLKESDKMPAIEIEKQYKNLPPIACYPSQLNQVFMNILSNAIDALEDAHQQGKTIFPKIQIRTEITDRQTVKIAIADNGGGMTESIRQKLFDPFFTTKPVGKGTGLGLSISYSIVVDKHGGQLTCHSLLGKGTEFTIEIPQQQLSKMQTWRSTNL